MLSAEEGVVVDAVALPRQELAPGDRTATDLLQLPGDPADEHLLLRAAQLRFVLRRHVADADHLQDLLPALDILAASDVGADIVKHKFRLLRLLAMAVGAELLQEGNVLFPSGARGGGGGGKEEERG